MDAARQPAVSTHVELMSRSLSHVLVWPNWTRLCCDPSLLIVKVMNWSYRHRELTSSKNTRKLSAMSRRLSHTPQASQQLAHTQVVRDVEKTQSRIDLAQLDETLL
ncbi:hypothetical protein J6590_055258 [Homalodisca vitripennis]|nr:hypothetical protein J6590_055258 [Homalodisca vitripennis]